MLQRTPISPVWQVGQCSHSSALLPGNCPGKTVMVSASQQRAWTQVQGYANEGRATLPISRREMRLRLGTRNTVAGTRAAVPARGLSCHKILAVMDSKAVRSTHGGGLHNEALEQSISCDADVERSGNHRLGPARAP